jgi:hypothetical protein
VDAELPEFKHLAVGKFRHFRNFAVSHRHEVTRGIWIFVHQEERGFTSRNHQVSGIVVALGSLAEKVSAGLMLSLEVFDPPWCP